MLLLIFDLTSAYEAISGGHSSYINCYYTTILLVFIIILPFKIYEFSVKQLTQTIDRWGSIVKLNLREEFFSWHWEKGLSGQIKWSLFFELKKTEDCWWLYLDKNLALHLPTDQLSPEAQAFILQKLTEYNVPIKG